MNKKELIEFLKKNMSIELSSINNSRGCRFVVKLSIGKQKFVTILLT
jgi:hypothetical protein